MGASIFNITPNTVGALIGGKIVDKIEGAIFKDGDGNVYDGGAFNEDNIEADITGSAAEYTAELDYNNQDTVVQGLQDSGPKSQQRNTVIFGEDISDAYTAKVAGEHGMAVFKKDAQGNNVEVSKAVTTLDHDSMKGSPTVPSLMNGFAVIRHKAAKGPDYWLDISNQHAFPKYTTSGGGIEIDGSVSMGRGGRKLTIESLLTDFNKNISDKKDPRYPMPYYATDFMYAKHFKNIPLNRLITLRRFPHPTYDNLQFGAPGAFDASDKNPVPTSKGGAVQSYKPMAQAITYFGEPTGNKLEDLTKINGMLSWKSLESEVNIVRGETVAGYEQTPFAGKMGNFGKAASILTGKGDLSGRGEEQRKYDAQYTSEDFLRRPYGPVNSIVKTHIRDRGIEGNMKFSLTFEYQLRSYAGINPRLALLDAYCNMLALTFNNAKFWGGANRFFPNDPQFAFLGDQKAFYKGDYESYIKSFTDDIRTSAGVGLNGLKDIVDAILNMNFMGAIKALAKNVGGTLLDLQSAKGRPQLIGFKALLSGDPTGEWHMVVGNPYMPILQIGNLIMKDFDCMFSGHLGADDFPTEMKWVINLEQGMPRDKAGLESIFNYGEGKMYYKPVEKDANNVTTSGKGTGAHDEAHKKEAHGEHKKEWAHPSDYSPKLGRNTVYDSEYLHKIAGSLF